MPLPVVIDTDQTNTVMLTADQSSLTIDPGVSIAGPAAASGFGVDATAGAGGTIVVFGSVSGGGGIYDPSSTRSGYNVVVHSQGSISATMGYGIALQNQANVTNHGHIIAQQVGISIGNGSSVVLNDGVIEAAQAVQIAGTGSIIANTGSMICATDGIVVIGNDHAITNAGLIQAGRFGILAGDQNSKGIVVTNTGTIVADSLAIRGNGNADEIINRGSILGHIDLRSGADFLDDRAGTITGHILLGSGNDTALGGAGNETFCDWSGDDFIDAGDGLDTLTFESSQDTSLPVHVDLRIQTGQASVWGTDVFLNFENVTGGAGDDTITGSDSANILKGLAGSDSLDGAGGDDTLEGGDGNDMLQGGDGSDTVVYGGTTIVVVDLRLEVVQDTGHGNDALSGIENVIGGSASDRLTGNSAANLLVGDGGADLLSGDAGNDTLNGGAGNDVMDGGEGENTAVFSGVRAGYGLARNGDGSITVTGQDGTDLLWNIRFARFGDATVDLAGVTLPIPSSPVPPASLVLRGTAGADTLSGQDGGDRIYGLAGNDKLYGNAGHDTIYGGAGKDVLSGGAGKDVFVFDTAFSRKTNLDRITDFRVVDDTIWLDNALFKKNKALYAATKKGTEAHPLKMNAKFFTIGDKAKDADDYFVYNKAKGVLYYDADGSGTKAAVEIATLSKNLKLTYKDFFFV